MHTQLPDPRSGKHGKHRTSFPWIVALIISAVFIIILAFILITLLILSSQGTTQGINTLTIISIVGGFVIGVLSLLVSFLQWHHPKDPSASEKNIPTSFVQITPLNTLDHSQATVLSNDPQQKPVEQNTLALTLTTQAKRHLDWGEAPHVDQLYGREKELALLKQWLVDDHCRLVAILGMGGIGKTGMAASLVDQIHEHYDYVFWRSLYNAPPLESILQECVQFFSLHTDTTLPAEMDRQTSLLLDFFRDHRCLLILDNAESILQGGSQAGHYREGYEGYGRLLQRLGESKHQSSLLLTSREKPPEVALLEGAAATRSFHLGGLKPADGQGILKDKGLQGTEDDWDVLFTHYGGNPLALKLVAQVIREVFGSTITAFLQSGELFFRDVRNVLEQQMKRLSAREEEIVYWLAIERESIMLSDLQEDIVHPMSKGELQEAVSSLKRRQLIETSTIGITLHPVIMEYLTDRFVDRISEEIKTEKLEFFERYALLKAQAKDYIRESQRRLILQPLVQSLLAIFSKEALEKRFQILLANLHAQHDHHTGYAAGNVLNLLIELGCTLHDYDFSHLVVRQAYLQGVALPDVNFAHADLAKSVFTDTFGCILCVAFSPQGDLLVAGTTTGEVRVWHAATSLPLHTFRGHTNWVCSVAFSSDGKTVASGSDDQTVRLWEVSSGRSLNILQGHTRTVRTVIFSPDGKTVASGSDDQTVRLWEVSSGKLINTLRDHTHVVWSVVFSLDGKTLASGSSDQTVRLWEVNSGTCLNILRGHSRWVNSVAFSPDGKSLASGGDDQTVRLWEVSSGKLINTLYGHIGVIWSVAFSPDGKTLASGSADQMVRLWEMSSGKLLNILRGHTHVVWSVVFSPDGKTLVSGSDDQTVRLWEMSSGQCLNTLQGYVQEVRSVAFSPDGKTLASGSGDQTVRLWEVNSGTCLNILRGHSYWVSSVAFSPDGKTLASGGDDQTVRLWEVSSGQSLTILQGHRDWVNSIAFSPNRSILASGSGDQTVRLWEVNSGTCLNILRGHSRWVNSVAFSPDGKTLASGGDDQTVRLWEVNSGTCLNILRGHSHWVRSVAFSLDGKILASGGADQTVRLWEVSSGKSLNTLQGHTRTVRTVIFSPDGKTLASGSDDQTVRLWETGSGKLLNTLQGHTRIVYSVAFSPDGKTLASGSADQTVRLWETGSGQCLCTLRSDRPYEQMNITHIKGLTEIQKATLKSLGAIENEE